MESKEVHECCICNIQYNPASNVVTETNTPYMFLFSQCQHMICHECMNGQVGSLLGTIDLPCISSFEKKDFVIWRKITSIADALKRMPKNGVDLNFSRFDDEGNEVFKSPLKCPQCRQNSILTRVPLLFSAKREEVYKCPNSSECKFVAKSIKNMQDHLLEKCNFSKYMCPMENCREIVHSSAIYSPTNWNKQFSQAVRTHIEMKKCKGSLVCCFCGKQTSILEFEGHYKTESLLWKTFEKNRASLRDILDSPDENESRENAKDARKLYKFTEEMLDRASKLFEPTNS